MLCSPVTSAGASSVDVYFPGGSDELWYDIDTYKQYKGEGTAAVPVDMAKVINNYNIRFNSNFSSSF